MVVSNHWTGLLYWIAGLDCWTGLLDWIAGLDLICSYHEFHPFKSAKFGYINCLMLFISCTSSSHCMVENVQECTLHKLLYRCVP